MRLTKYGPGGGEAKVITALLPGAHEDEWRQAGVKTFVFAGCDVLATLRAAHDILGIK